MTVANRIERDYWPTNDWRPADPEAVGMSPAALADLQAFGEDPESQLNGVVVVRNGYVVYERYFGGFHAGSYHTLNSITKSVVSTLVGIALQRNLISSLDDPIANWFPEVNGSKMDARARGIAVRHLLTMTGGWAPAEDDLSIFGTSPSLVLDGLRRPIAHAPGSRFWYDNHSAHLVSVLMSRAAAQNTAAFAHEALLGPLGIWTEQTPRFVWRTEAGGPHRFHRFANWDEQTGLPWKVDLAGDPTGYAGLHLTVREIAKLGYLWLNGGRWDEVQLVPEQYVALAIQPQSAGGKPGDAAYGYFWWVQADRPEQHYFAFGAGGQYVFVSPALDLVAAMASSGTGYGGKHGGYRTRDLFDRIIIPAVVG
jgi:CubicO group peptidase (beta-lactamase class C family)